MFEVDFIVVVKNQLAFTEKCIESVLRHIPEPYHLIVIDNGSTDGTPAYLEKIKNRIPRSSRLTVYRSEENLGYARGLNQGLQFSNAPYVFFCNNDIEFFPGSVSEMIQIANKSSNIGLVNPNSNEFGLKGYDKSFLDDQKGKIVERCHTSGFCVLVKQEVIQKIGGIDPEFGPAYFEDMDFAERARQAGFLCVVARGAYIHHYGTKTFLATEKQALWDKNRKLFIKRWGGTKWFGYLGNGVFDPKKTRESLLSLARRNTAIIYIFIPKFARSNFENLHDSFRIVEVPSGFGSLVVLGKVLTNFSNKPISRLYFSNPHQVENWKKLSWLHRAETLTLD